MKILKCIKGFFGWVYNSFTRIVFMTAFLAVEALWIWFLYKVAKFLVLGLISLF